MRLLLENQTMVIMGVANKWSIAWGIAKKFSEEGARIIFTYYGEKSLRSIEKLVEEEKLSSCDYFSCDVTKDEEIQKTFDGIQTKYGKIHGVVHSIAHANKDELQGYYYNTSRDGYLMAQNISAYSFVAVARCAQAIMPEGGSLTTLSYLGGERVVKNYNVMGVAKAALESSVQYLAHDLGEKQIRVNAISAGPVKTLAAKGVSGFNDLANAFIEKSPMKRMVTVEEIANTALFLNSHLGSGVSGEVIHVDCGYFILGY
jgi:enoyl-[acyl-carrier protein] reductase I